MTYTMQTGLKGPVSVWPQGVLDPITDIRLCGWNPKCKVGAGVNNLLTQDAFPKKDEVARRRPQRGAWSLDRMDLLACMLGFGH